MPRVWTGLAWALAAVLAGASGLLAPPVSAQSLRPVEAPSPGKAISVAPQTAGSFAIDIPAASFVGESLTLSATWDELIERDLEPQDALPSWLTFADDGDGSGTLAALNAPSGIYHLRVTATNAVGAAASDFALMVDPSCEGGFDFERFAPVAAGNVGPARNSAVEISDHRVVGGGAQFRYTLPEGAFTDADVTGGKADFLCYKAEGMPSWMSFRPQTRMFYGTPLRRHIAPDAPVEITVKVRDYANGQASDTFTVTVVGNEPPIAPTYPAVVDVAEGKTFAYAIPDAADYGLRHPDAPSAPGLTGVVSLDPPIEYFSDPDGDALSYRIQSKPDWVIYNADERKIVGKPSAGDIASTTVNANGYAEVAVIASDGSSYAEWTVLLRLPSTEPETPEVANRAPEVDNPIADHTFTEAGGTTYAIPANAFSDPDGDPLNVRIPSLPPWLSYDTATGTITADWPTYYVFSGTRSNNIGGQGGNPSHLVAVAEDPSLERTFDIFRISMLVENSGPERGFLIGEPTAEEPRVGTVTAYANTPFRFPVPSKAFQDGDGDPNGRDLAYSADESVDWLGFDGVEFYGTPAKSDIGADIPLITVVATDSLGRSASSKFKLSVAKAPKREPRHVLLETANSGDYSVTAGSDTNAKGTFDYFDNVATDHLVMRSLTQRNNGKLVWKSVSTESAESGDWIDQESVYGTASVGLEADDQTRWKYVLSGNDPDVTAIPEGETRYETLQFRIKDTADRTRNSKWLSITVSIHKPVQCVASTSSVELPDVFESSDDWQFPRAGKKWTYSISLPDDCNTYGFSRLPAWLTEDRSVEGRLSVSGIAPAGAGQTLFDFDLTATDPGNGVASRRIDMFIVPSITESPNADKSVSNRSDNLTASGSLEFVANNFEDVIVYGDNRRSAGPDPVDSSEFDNSPEWIGHIESLIASGNERYGTEIPYKAGWPSTWVEDNWIFADTTWRYSSGTYGILRHGANGDWLYVLDINDTDTRALQPGSRIQESFAIAVRWANSGNPPFKRHDPFYSSNPLIITIDIAIDSNRYPVAGGSSVSPRTFHRSAKDPSVSSYDWTLPDDLFTDPDGDELTYSVTPDWLRVETLPSGRRAVRGTRSVDDTLPSGSRMTITATDPNGLSATREFGWAVNYFPTGVDDDFSIVASAGETTVGNVLDNDSDRDGDSLSVGLYWSYVGGARQASCLGSDAACSVRGDYGELTIVSGGEATYTPFAATASLASDAMDRFGYNLGDSSGGSTPNVGITVNLTVPDNNLPVANDDSFAAKTATKIFSVLENDMGDNLRITKFWGPGEAGTPGRASIAFENAPNFDDAPSISSRNSRGYYISMISSGDVKFRGSPGIWKFEYQVTDSSGRKSNAVITFTVSVNNPPVAEDDSITVTSGSGTGNVLANDGDPDGGSISVTRYWSVDSANVRGAEHAAGTEVSLSSGRLTISADGSATFTQVVGATLSNSRFEYEISDGTDTATAYVTVNENNSPVAGIVEDQIFQWPFGVELPEAAFSDPDGDTLAYTATGMPAWMSFDGPTGFFGGNLDLKGPSDPRTASVTVTATDPHGATASVSFSITLNLAPFAAPDRIFVDSDAVPASAPANIVTNDTDAEGDGPLTVYGYVHGHHAEVAEVVFSYPAEDIAGTYGTLNVPEDGQGTYTLNEAAKTIPAGTSRTDNFTYIVLDSLGGWSVGYVSVIVNGPNLPPYAEDDRMQTGVASSGYREGALNVLDNDDDPETRGLSDKKLTVTRFWLLNIDGTRGLEFAAGQSMTNVVGTFTLASDGAATFSGTAVFSAMKPGAWRFEYEISDSRGATATAIVGLPETAAPTNVAPTAPDRGLAVDASDAAKAVNLFTGAIVPVSGNRNTAYAPYPAIDPDGDHLHVSRFASGTDIGSGAVVSCTHAQHCDVTSSVAANRRSVVAGFYGTLVVWDTGAAIYHPNAASLAPGLYIDTFVFEITDALASDTATLTVALDVPHPNRAPVAGVVEDQIFQWPFMLELPETAFSDPDGDTLTYSATGMPAWMTFDSTEGGAFGGNLALKGPGDPRTVAVTVTATDPDGAAASVSFSITLNHAPFAAPDRIFVDIDADPAPALVPANIIANDTDTEGDGPLTVYGYVHGRHDDVAEVVFSYPAEDIAGTYGTLNVPEDGQGTFTLNAAAKTVPAGTSRIDNFTYIVLDSLGGWSVGYVSVIVNGPNLPPYAEDDRMQTGVASSGYREGALNVLDNDDDPETRGLSDKKLTVTRFWLLNIDGTRGLEFAAGQSMTNVVGSFTLASDGAATFSGTAVFSAMKAGAWRFEYEIRDSRGATATAIVGFPETGPPTNVVPTAPDRTLAIGEDLAAKAVNLFTGAEVPVSGNHNSAYAPYPAIDSDGDNLHVSKFAAGTDIGTGAVVSCTHAQHCDVTSDVAANRRSVVAGSYGTLLVWDAGAAIYYPNAASLAPGQYTDTFVFEISDTLASDTATLTVTLDVPHPNRAPVAQGDLFDIVAPQSFSLVLLTVVDGNAAPAFVDPDGDSLTYSFAGLPSWVGLASFQTFEEAAGIESLDMQNFSYNLLKRNSGDPREYTVTVSASDGRGGIATRYFTIYFNRAPTAVGDRLEVPSQATTPASINVLANDSDEDGDSIVVSDLVTESGSQKVPSGSGLTFEGKFGTLTLSESGNATYLPNATGRSIAAGTQGTDSFRIRVSDDFDGSGESGLSSLSSLTVVVSGGNLPPVASSDEIVLSSGSGRADVLSNDFDPEGGSLSVTRYWPVDSRNRRGTEYVAGREVFKIEGRLTITADGQATFRQTSGVTFSNGIVRFEYEVSDGVDTATAYVSVNESPNRAPVAVDDSLSGPLQTTANVLTNDSDPDGDSLEVSRFWQEDELGAMVAGTERLAEPLGTPPTDKSHELSTSFGTFKIRRNGRIVFQRSELVALGTVRIGYEMTDGLFVATADLTINLNVQEVPLQVRPNAKDHLPVLQQWRWDYPYEGLPWSYALTRSSLENMFAGADGYSFRNFPGWLSEATFAGKEIGLRGTPPAGWAATDLSFDVVATTDDGGAASVSVNIDILPRFKGSNEPTLVGTTLEGKLDRESFTSDADWRISLLAEVSSSGASVINDSTWIGRIENLLYGTEGWKREPFRMNAHGIGDLGARTINGDYGSIDFYRNGNWKYTPDNFAFVPGASDTFTFMIYDDRTELDADSAAWMAGREYSNPILLRIDHDDYIEAPEEPETQRSPVSFAVGQTNVANAWNRLDEVEGEGGELGSQSGLPLLFRNALSEFDTQSSWSPADSRLHRAGFAESASTHPFAPSFSESDSSLSGGSSLGFWMRERNGSFGFAADSEIASGSADGMVLGLERGIGERLSAGVMLERMTSRVRMRDGEVVQRDWTVSPYWRWSREDLRAWGTFGHGAGEVEYRERVHSTNAYHVGMGVGADLGRVGAFQFEGGIEGVSTFSEIDRADDVYASGLRAEIEAGVPLEISVGTMRPYVTFGRHWESIESDREGALNGVGLDLDMPAGFELEASARQLSRADRTEYTLDAGWDRANDGLGMIVGLGVSGNGDAGDYGDRDESSQSVTFDVRHATASERDVRRVGALRVFMDDGTVSGVEAAIERRVATGNAAFALERGNGGERRVGATASFRF